MLSRELLKNIKLIVFDLDGTLLDDQGNIGSETVDLVERLKNKGVTFSFASGRLHCAVTGFAARLNLKAPLISTDGSLIKSYPEGQTVYESYVPEKYVKRAIRYADELLLKIALCHDDAIYYHEFNSAVPNILDKYGAEFREVQSLNGLEKRALEVVIAGEQSDSLKYLAGRFSFPYAFGLNTSYYKSHFHKGIYYLEIRKSGSSKGLGLKRLIRYLRTNIRETAVIGDWYNDRSMFETDAVKIAVANAVPEIRRMAQYVTKRTNNEDGTAEFLEMVLRSKEG